MPTQPLSRMSEIERIPTHIEGLDEKMQGGIPQGHISIVAGASGAMKSSLTFSMLYNAVLYGETSGIYVTLSKGKIRSGPHGQHGHERR